MVYFLLCFLSVMLLVYLFLYLGYIVGLTTLKVADFCHMSEVRLNHTLPQLRQMPWQ